MFLISAALILISLSHHMPWLLVFWMISTDHWEMISHREDQEDFYHWITKEAQIFFSLAVMSSGTWDVLDKLVDFVFL